MFDARVIVMTLHPYIVWTHESCRPSLSLTRCTVRIFKIDATIRNGFPKCICGASPPQTGRLLPQIRRLLPRTGKFFSEERWARTHISFWNTVRLRLRIFRIRVKAFRVCVCLRILDQWRKGFRIVASILKMRTVWNKASNRRIHVAIFLDMYTDMPTFIQKPTCPSFCLSLSYSFSLFLLSWSPCTASSASGDEPGAGNNSCSEPWLPSVGCS